MIFFTSRGEYVNLRYIAMLYTYYVTVTGGMGAGDDVKGAVGAESGGTGGGRGRGAETGRLTRPRSRRRLPPIPGRSPFQSSSRVVAEEGLPGSPTLSGSAAGVPAADVPACCRCNHTGSCKRCVCVKAGRPCASCLPVRLERCRNLPSPLPSIPSMPALPAAAGISRPRPNIHPRDIPIDALPPLHSILGLRTPTLRHVPKGLRDVWATVVGEVLASLLASPNQIESWCKLFMLPRCILSSPPRGGRSHWREVLSLVRSRIQKWRDGGISELWANVTAKEKKLKARLSRPKSYGPSPESLCGGNAIRARRAVDDG